ncbi:MAG TPA: hypothetical protein VM238_15550 [Phycisphaerae bacterium]|nr:hypothetical protein [Phycisphaerae bacterium]
MRFALSVTLVSTLLLAGAVGAEAQGVPWKPGDAGKDAAGAAATDLKAELPAAQYNRIIKPIEAKLDAAQKMMATHDKEEEKAAEKRNERLLLTCKTRAAESYLGAATAAKKGMGMVKDESQKAAIQQQYEEPNRKKAIDLFLDLATTAHAKGDVRMAVAYYKRILAIDKENAEAKEGLTKIAQTLKESAQSGKKSGTKGGGSDDKRSWDRDDHSRTGRTENDWSKTGRSSW